MDYEISGVIEVISPTSSHASRDGQTTYYRRDLVVNCTRYDSNTGAEYPNFPKFELSGDKCQLLDNFSVGQRVTIKFFIRGVKYADATGAVKYFSTLGVKDIALVQTKTESPRPQVVSQPQAAPQPPKSEYSSDLPF